MDADTEARIRSLEYELHRLKGSAVTQTYPNRADMWHAQSLVTVGNALTKGYWASQMYAALAYQDTAANGDTFTNGCFLAAGTYTFSVLGVTGTDRGKVDWSLDGTVFASAQNWYNGSPVLNVIKTTSSVVVATSGWHQLKGVVGTVSGGYMLPLTKMWFTPAAD